MDVRYERSELGTLYPDRGAAELPFVAVELDELIEEGTAEGADLTPASTGVSHDVHGPVDVTAVLELFDRRYREVRARTIPTARRILSRPAPRAAGHQGADQDIHGRDFSEPGRGLPGAGPATCIR
jgi:hypothetical protein